MPARNCLASGAVTRCHYFTRPWCAASRTASLELFVRHVANVDVLYVPIGLGSGICGALAARDALALKTAIVGVVSAAAPAYARSFALGRPCFTRCHLPGLLTAWHAGRPTKTALETIRAGVDCIVEVTDDEVEEAMRVIFTDTHNVVEGAGDASLAGLLQERDCLRCVSPRPSS